MGKSFFTTLQNREISKFKAWKKTGCLLLKLVAFDMRRAKVACKWLVEKGKCKNEFITQYRCVFVL